MFKLLVEKELKLIIASPKFAATFAACSILILLSIFVGIQEYRANVRQYHTARQLTDQRLAEAGSWLGMQQRAFREPHPLQIFLAGVHNDIGRFSDIDNWEEVKLRRSIYSDDPIFAVFRFIDFAFIVQVVFSLFAILFTYDAVTGERESGTLKLSFANPLSRVSFIVAKFAGAWLGLIVPLLIPILLGILMVLLYRVPLDAGIWLQLAAVMGVSLLYFTFFIAFGLFVSSATRRSATAFLLLLVSWIVFTLIIPRAGVMLAGQIIPVPTVAEVESRQDAYAQSRWQQYESAMADRYEARNSALQNLSPEEREAEREANMWNWLEEEDGERNLVKQEISEHHRKLQEDLRNRRIVRERMAYAVARISPAATYQLAALRLSGTDVDLKTRYEDAMLAYRQQFVKFTEARQKESGDHGGLRISMSAESGFNISTGSNIESVDLSELPAFSPPRQPLIDLLTSALPDLLLLTAFVVFSFAAAFLTFMRYDVR